MPRRGDQLSLFVGFEQTRDSEKNKQAIINGVRQIENATKRQGRLFSETGAQTQKAGRQLRLFSNVTKGSTRDITANQKVVEGLRNSTGKLSSTTTSSARATEDLTKKTQDTSRAKDRLTKSSGEAGKGMRKMGFDITFVAWHLRFLGNILTRISQQFVRTIREWITTGAELQDRLFGLAASTSLYGLSAEDARKAAETLASKGLVPLTTATEAYNNILLTGAFSVEQATDFLERFLDVATLVTAGQDEMAKSMVFLTQSIMRGTMVLGTDIVTRSLWNMAEARSISLTGKTLQQLSAKERAMAVLVTLHKDFNAILGLHEVRMHLIGASLTRVTERYQGLKLQLAEALWPAIIAISEALVTMANIIGKVVNALGPLFPAIIIGTAVALSFFGAFLTGTAVILGFGKVLAFTRPMILSYQTALIAKATALKAAGAGATFAAVKVTLLSKAVGFLYIATRKLLPFLLILDAIVIGLTFLWIKFSGANKKAAAATNELSEAQRKLQEEILQSSELFGKVTDEEDEADSSRALAHRRRVEDLEEELEREISKGLWADQIRIKDLQKRLSREKEDWDAYLKDRKSQTGKEGGFYDQLTSMLNSLVDETEMATDEIAGFWSTLYDKIRSGWKKLWDDLPLIAKIGLASLVGVIGVNMLLKALGYATLGTVILSLFKAGIVKVGAWLAGTGAVTVLLKLAAGILASKFLIAAALLALAAYMIYTLRDELKEFFVNLHKNINNWLDERGFETVGEAIGEYIRRGIIRVLEFFTNLADKVTGWLDSKDWEKIGENIGRWIGEKIVEIGKFSFKYNFVTLPFWITKWLIEADWKAVGEKIGEFMNSGVVRVLTAFFTLGLSELIRFVVTRDEHNFRGVGTAIGELITSAIAAFFSSGRAIRDFSSGLRSGLTSAIRDAMPSISFPSLPSLDWSRLNPQNWNLPQINPRSWVPWQTGHLQVPGRIGEPIPALLHGGERIVPQHETGTAGATNVINIYNPSVRNDDDIRKLANAVSDVLSQKQRWARLGSYNK